MRGFIAQRPVHRRVMFHSAPLQKKWKARPLSEPGLMLAREEHEQDSDELHGLLVAQLELELEFDHGCFP